MIPLERWNTEHRFDFHSKRIPGDNRLSSLIGPMERTVSRSVPVCSGLAAQKAENYLQLTPGSRILRVGTAVTNMGVAVTISVLAQGHSIKGISFPGSWNLFKNIFTRYFPQAAAVNRTIFDLLRIRNAATGKQANRQGARSKKQQGRGNKAEATRQRLAMEEGYEKERKGK